jgi:hypothetical protein
MSKISPALPSFTAESGSSKMESDISVSGKGKNAGSKEKPFSGFSLGLGPFGLRWARPSGEKVFYFKIVQAHI